MLFPVSASEFLVGSVARRTYGLEGYVTGNCGAIADMVRGHNYAEKKLKDIKADLIVCDGVITQYMTSTFWFDSDTTKPDATFF